MCSASPHVRRNSSCLISWLPLPGRALADVTRQVSIHRPLKQERIGPPQRVNPSPVVKAGRHHHTRCPETPWLYQEGRRTTYKKTSSKYQWRSNELLGLSTTNAPSIVCCRLSASVGRDSPFRPLSMRQLSNLRGTKGHNLPPGGKTPKVNCAQ